MVRLHPRKHAGQDRWCDHLSYKEAQWSSILRPGTIFRGTHTEAARYQTFNLEKAEFESPASHHELLMTLHRLVLVLNASYEPIHIVPARRALTLVLGGKAIVEERSKMFVRTATLRIPIPSVIRLVTYRRMPRHNRSVSRKGILLRDANTCQYCGAVLPSKELTMDHVVPRSRGGGSTWENLVACCFACNNRKGSRIPQEAGMALAKQPRQISIHAKHRLLAPGEATWERYLF